VVEAQSDGPASLWLVPVSAKMLPFACLGFRVVTEQGFMDIILAYLLAHLYYLLAVVVPQVRGRDVLVTPQFLINYFRIGEYRPVRSVRGRDVLVAPQFLISFFRIGVYRPIRSASASMERDDDSNQGTPELIIDANLTEGERATIRANRAAAAEARLQKQGGGATGTKKKQTDNSTPLIGPHSQPTMRWTAG
jgi:hypothetical protein